MGSSDSIRIMIIDDNAEVAENISRILRLASYEVNYAPGGQEGIELMKQLRPDLILCDIVMPHLDGYEVLHIVNNDPVLMHIPFIFLTGKGLHEDFRSGMNLGADDYITKPFRALDLLKVIEIRLKKRRERDDRQAVMVPSPPGDLESLLMHKRIRLFRKKELIYLEGQSSFEVYYIFSGNIKTYKVNYEGKELITGSYSAGSFFGYIPLLEEKPHHESAEVREDAQIAIIPQHEFLEILFNNKALAKRFLKLISSDLIETESRLLEIAYKSVRQRVAGALLKISRDHPADSEMIITTTRRDISNIIGTATESLNRTLADFKDEGVLEIRDEGLRIISRQKLEQNCR